MSTPPGDPQSRAYREAGPADRWDGDLLNLAGRVFMPITNTDQITLPGDYEQGIGWDTDRQPPKTLTEARERLAERIADPNAPDTDAEAGAYEGLGDDA